MPRAIYSFTAFFSLPLTRQILLGMLVAALVSGCATTDQNETAIPDNPEVIQAQSDLAEAEQRGAVWMVRDPVFDGKLVSLQDLLARAIQLRDANNQAAASEIAVRVSRYARLGIAQADDQANAAPFYPQ